LLVLAGTIGLNVYLISIIPKGFFPEQDTGLMIGSLQGDQSISFQLLSKKLTEMMTIVHNDPAVHSVVGFTGAGGGGASSQTNTGSMYISLNPLSTRPPIDAVIARLRRKLSVVPGGRLFLQAAQDIRVGGRQSNAQYQYTVLGDSTEEVYKWAPKLLAAMEKDPTFVDVSSDQQQSGLETDLQVDRATASRLGLTLYQIDNTLYDAFGQRSVSTIYNALNQYHVVMEIAPQYWQRPSMLNQIWVSTSGAPAAGSQTTALSGGSVSAPTARTGPAMIKPASMVSLSSLAASQNNLSSIPVVNPTVLVSNPTMIGANMTVLGAGGRSSASSSSASSSSSANNAVRTAAQASLGSTGASSASTGAAVATSVESMVPLSAFAKFGPGNTPLAVNHQSQFVATTISFNLPANKSLSDAQAAIARATQAIHLPASITGGFAGTALVYEQSLSGEALLIVAALGAIYIVLGILYESFVHPITIISTLPSAGVGAILALLLFGIQFTIIALIGVILLIGIVKKNAILMIDFALEAERNEGMDSRQSIFHAAVMRFRPIMMTTCAAILGALPLCFSFGEGSELRQPLGISIVGGLLLSQLLTLYTTPIVYLTLDRLRFRRHAAPSVQK
jgi:multidrug efflux pump subunit AcrB